MRIQSIKIEKLFNFFDHKIDLNLKEGITIIHSPNGYGKTIILKMLQSLFNQSFYIFFKIPFKIFSVTFDNGSQIEISKNNNKISQKYFNKQLNKNYDYEFEENNSEEFIEKIAPRRIRESFPYLERISPTLWIDVRTNIEYSTQEVLLKLEDEEPPGLFNDLKMKNIFSNIEFANIQRVYFIQDQRLLQKNTPRYRRHSEEPLWIESVLQNSKEISEIIKNTEREYAKLSQELDTNFVSRILENSIRKEKFTYQNIELLLKNLQDKITKLSKFGLYDIEVHNKTLKKFPSSLVNVGDSDLKVIFMSIEDQMKKLEVFDNLLKRIELFTEILNVKKLKFKKIQIDKNKGYIFKTDDEKDILASDLSSGEQNELILNYELIFKIQPNTLVLIDEPEISLHVEWQHDFLNDLEKIIQLQKIDFLIATHSPQIIGEKWNLTVRLEEPKRKSKK
ncbi:MAG: putative excinuclease ATPase subunit [Ignavibacteria bacterium]|nr:putative excinuclease ATPase subunit [Ignavibacteria bacterium]